jgi:hypothetical protein
MQVECQAWAIGCETSKCMYLMMLGHTRQPESKAISGTLVARFHQRGGFRPATKDPASQQ